MKLTVNGKEYEVDVTVTTNPHEGIGMKLSYKGLSYEGPFDISRVFSFLESTEVVEAQ